MPSERREDLIEYLVDGTMHRSRGVAVGCFFGPGPHQMRIEPLDDKVVVKRLDAETKTMGGLLLPDGAQEKPRQGKVLSVGSGRINGLGVRQPPQVAEGDRIVFSTYAGMEISVDGDELLILSEDEILAIIG